MTVFDYLQELGKYGIICMEDLVHEIFTVGPHFKEGGQQLLVAVQVEQCSWWLSEEDPALH